MRALVLLALVVSGCVLPTLEALERERARACDADHPCAIGYGCTDGRCVKGGVLECEAGEVRACGSGTGECRPGMQRCDAGFFDSCAGGVSPAPELCDNKDNDCDGTTDEEAATAACERMVGVCQASRRSCVTGVAEAVCSGLSYGPLYETTETRCDGRDNDCDGEIDESLPAVPCALTRGVCAGATTTCRAGTSTCSAVDYESNDRRYEPAESRCDGADNDCDGVTDVFAPIQISDAGPNARRVVAVARPNGDQLIMYEVGARVMTRVLSVDGGMSAERFPSFSVAMAAQRAELPALAISGAQVMEAWFELLPSMKYRLVIAQANDLGEATVGGVPSVTLVQPRVAVDGGMPVPPGPGQALRLAMTPSRLVVAWANFDDLGINTAVSIASCPLALDDGCSILGLGAGRSPSLLVEADTAWVGFENAGGVRVVRVSVPASGVVTLAATVDLGAAGSHDTVLAGTGAMLNVYYAVPRATESLSRATGNCTTTCLASGFTTTPNIASFVGIPSNFSAHPATGGLILAWDEGPAGGRVVKVMRVGNAPIDVGPGRRPVPVVGAGMTPHVFFETDTPSTVVRRTFCSL